jgi:hypothetical protein
MTALLEVLQTAFVIATLIAASAAFAGKLAFAPFIFLGISAVALVGAAIEKRRHV